MANLRTKGGIYAVRFRFQGRQFTKSLKTRSKREADIALKSVELTIHRLLTGQASVPSGLDAGDYIVSGGTLRPAVEPIPAPIFPSTRELIDRYLRNKLPTISASYHASQRIHLNHLTRFLGDAVDGPCHQVTQKLLEEYLLGRLKTRDPQTVMRERITLLQFYKWVLSRQDVPAFASPIDGLPTFKSKKDPTRFKTVAEIEAIIARGGLTEEQSADAWECLYLCPQELAELLALVRSRAVDQLSFILHAIPAYTGMRRGEVLRLPWADVDFDGGYVTAQSRKQSRTNRETRRRINLHGELRMHLLQWREQRPKGQLVAGDSKTLAELTPDRANWFFWKPMRGTPWCLNTSRNWFKIGFHTYRHSFASNLASLQINQRIIDRWMGHQTDEMRERYQHLFPNQRQEAINSFSLAVPTSA